jgi:hypothetical protein
MRVAAAFVLAACASTPSDPTGPQTFSFGPYTIGAGEEVTNQCVQITLHDAHDLYVNQVELTTGPGFHHSNWFYVPESEFFGDDGTFTCDDRNFSEPAAALFGGVLFAQSTQSAHEVQSFPPGVAIRVPAHSKLVAQIHLLNPAEQDVMLAPTIALTPIAQAEVTTQLAAISFEDHALGLPPRKQSRFSVDCDLGTTSQQVAGGPPDFSIYYALAHYHRMGTGMTVEAVKDDGSAATIYSTMTKIGDSLGGTIDPAFDFTGYTHLRFSCDYYNDTDTTVSWGNGSAEMCVFLAFSDSAYNWGGGVTSNDAPGDPTIGSDGVMTYTHGCSVFANPAAR